MVATRTVFRGSALGALAMALTATPAFAQESVEGDEDIIVTAQRDNQSQVSRSGSLGALGNKDAMDTPFAIKSYNSALILNQQPQTLGQVLENDPAIRTTNAYGTPAELFVVRGFTLFSDDIGFNGMYGLTPRQLVAPELYDQVQVLNGASAFLFGAAPGGSGLGGGINLISKRADDKPLTRATANYAGSAHFGGAFDVGRRYGDFGVRVNGAFRAGDVSVDDEFRRTLVVGSSFDWSTDNLKLTLDLAYQRLFVRGLRHKVGVSTVIPVVPRGNVNYAQQWQTYEQRDIFGIIGLEYKIAENAEIFASFGARDGMEEGVSINAIGITNVVTGDASGFNSQFTPRADNNEAAQAGLRVRGSTFGISHEFSLGTSLSWQVSRNAYERYGPYNTNIYNPVQVNRPAPNGVRGGNLTNPFPVARFQFHSVYASDTLGFADDMLLLTVGLRLQTIQELRYAYNDGVAPSTVRAGDETSRYEDSAVTPVVGLVFKPTENISLYANRIEGLVRGEVVNDPSLLNNGDIIPPFKTVQYEFGGKLAIGGINASLSFYQSDRPDPIVRTVPGGQVRVLDGLQRNRGVEFSLDGELTEGLRIISGVAVTDAKLARTQGGAFDGKKAVGVPDYTANANIEWDIIPAVTLTGRVVHTGPQAVNRANTLELDSWTRFDIGGRFVTVMGDTPITFRANVDNVANKRYWAAAFTNFPTFDTVLLQALPRTFKLSVTADF